MMLEISGVSKSFGEERVLDDISLSIAEGEVLALLGPSGSGKTTLLRIVAGLERADEGEVLLQGQKLDGVSVHERGFGMVFQDYALFPHKNVAENVAFGLRMRNWPRQQAQARVSDLLALVGLEGFEERAVYELSGGEQQRVALARALAPEPSLLLLDEPLGALDHALRERLLGELRQILTEAEALAGRERRITAIYVTHDQGEAFAVADRVAVLRGGRLQQVDTPVRLYRRPRTPFVARFLGMENMYKGRLVGRQPPTFSCSLGQIVLAKENILEGTSDEGQLLLVRPDAGRALREGNEAPNVVQGRLASLSFRGRYQEALIESDDGSELSLEFEAGVRLPDVGESIRLALAPAALILIQEEA